MKHIVFDSGALLALERREPRMWRLAQRTLKGRGVIFVPAGVLAQVWRGSPKQHDLSALLKSRTLMVEPLTEGVAVQIGRTLAATKTRDVVDAHVVLIGRKLDATVFTSDPGDLAKIDPMLTLVTV